jgi:hypothetical protein
VAPDRSHAQPAQIVPAQAIPAASAAGGLGMRAVALAGGARAE